MPLDVPSWSDEWCSDVLGSPPVEALFVVSHLSEVVGLRLGDGRAVVVKRRADECGRARACVAAQRILAEDGFPCPRPLTDVVVRSGFATHAEVVVEGGEVETEDDTAAAARSAVLLADLVRRLSTSSLDPPLPNPEWVRWDSPPQRHGIADAPDWLKAVSRRVRAKLSASRLPSVLGHADWEAQNMRWLHGQPLVVHDWDSLAWLPEAALVGTAAGVFASHREPTLAPIESSAAFLDAYDEARGKRLSAQEREIAWAASIWVALHNARDELIFDRPRLSYDELEAQHVERLERAKA